jgi:hypothetical protein
MDLFDRSADWSGQCNVSFLAVNGKLKNIDAQLVFTAVRHSAGEPSYMQHEV